MGKKLIGIAVIAIMLFGVFGLTGCDLDKELEQYKADAKAEIENYATESNYCTENWNIVCGIVDVGKQAVDAAENKAGVDTAIEAAKDAIDAVAREGEVERHSNSDTKIDATLENQIRRDIVSSLSEDSELTFEDIWISRFYGIYDESAALTIENILPKPSGGTTEIIAGFEFEFLYGPNTVIVVWKQGDFFSLLKAYEDGLLTIDDIESIWQQTQQ